MFFEQEGSRSDQRGNTGKDPQDAPARRPSNQRNRAAHGPGQKHHQGVAAQGRDGPAQVPSAGGGEQARRFHRDAGNLAQGRSASRQTRSPHHQGPVRSPGRAGLQRWLRAGRGLCAALARGGIWQGRQGRLRSFEVCAGRRVPVRLEHRICLGGRAAPAPGGGAHQAVWQPRLLAGGLSDPESRDAV